MVPGKGTEGNVLKSYTFYQGTQIEDNKIGTIDIPKDLVVKSGQVVVNPDGQPAGTYIKLVIANQDEPLYIDVKKLVDVYTAKENAEQVQVAISETNEVSATIVASSVTKTELNKDVNASLAKADTAIQNVSAGTPNGTISVDGTDVAVKGLGSAAFTDSGAYDENGAAATVKSELIGATGDTKDFNTINGAKAFATDAVTTAKSELIGGTGDTKDSNTISGAKKYADSIVADKNVGATGDTALITAEANDNTVTVTSTQKLKNAVTAAETALQKVNGTVNQITVTTKASCEQTISFAEDAIWDCGTCGDAQA